jgi:hypothetical protein
VDRVPGFFHNLGYQPVRSLEAARVTIKDVQSAEALDGAADGFAHARARTSLAMKTAVPSPMRDVLRRAHEAPCFSRGRSRTEIAIAATAAPFPSRSLGGREGTCSPKAELFGPRSYADRR